MSTQTGASTVDTALPLLPTEEEQDLRGAVRALLDDRAGWQAVLARTGAERPEEIVDIDLWRTLAADMGVAGLCMSDQLGGSEATWRQVAVVAEELGAAVAPVPFLGSAVMATATLLASPAIDASGLLAALATNRVTATLAVPLTTGPGDGFPTTVHERGGTLTGTVTTVADSLTADVLLVPAVGADDRRPGIWAVERGDLVITPVTSLDLTRPLADLRLDTAPGALVAGGADAEKALHHGLLVGAGMLAAEQLGIAERALSATVQYAKERHQFGRPIGSFQAVKHRLADLWVAVTQARAAVAHAAACLGSDHRDSEVAVAVAQAYAAPTAVLAAEEAVQLHGGIGFTWEHPAHLWLKRAKSDALALGTPEHHRARLAALVDLPPA